MNLAEKQNQITAQLAALKNGQERLMFLVEQARIRPPLAPESRVEKNRVPGCLAKLWLVAAHHAGRCYFSCDSDSLIVKAVAGLLCDFYSGQLPEEILSQEPDFLGPLGIVQHMTPNRRNALARVRGSIRDFAEAHSKSPLPEPVDRALPAESTSAASPGL